ncbi:CHAD domain-containing protein [Cellulomonas chitinilytica]|uniref:CHAD domain-containing protein n=1 Tax=Cellulomonas chitinilytica TaxID=398759 RepID=A0A919NYQ7_9CELL|nr:CYTH and CHAD domain-containing protein [Cellulomonas chitinilytica]GIG19992.1 CHAD domain-containing protein [Cellulomonas chitinilytica]
MGTHREVEAAFEVPDDASLPDLRGVGGLVASQRPDPDDLVAQYYDTASLDLLRAGVTLRRRIGGADEGWHLKVPARDAKDGARARTEHRLPLGDPSAPDALLDMVRARVRDRPVDVVAELRTRRVPHRWSDATGRAVVEVTDDHVHAVVHDGDERVVVTWREWEVELVDDDEGTFAAVTDRLGVVPGATARVSPKLERALGDRVPVRRAPEPRDDSAGEVVRAYVGRHLERLLLAHDGARRGDDGAVHDARVAIRRLRTALAVYRPVVDRTTTDPLRERLAEVGHALGAARDPHVELRGLLDRVHREPVELVLGPVADRLRDDRSRAWRDGVERLAVVLGSAAWWRLLDGLDAVADGGAPGPAAAQPAVDVIPRRAGRAWRRLDRRAEDLAATDRAPSDRAASDRAASDLAAADRPAVGPAADVARHEVRKAARRARYAAEVAVPVVGRPARRSARRARAVQDVLGAQHDTVVRRETLRRIGVQAHLDGENAFTFGRLHALEQAAGEAAAAEAERLLARARRPSHRDWMA